VAFSRRQDLKPRRLDLVAALKEWEVMVRRLLGSRFELRIESDPGTPAIHADPGQVLQVVLNLAINARDAMRDGGSITIRTSGRRKDGREWTALEVQDAGSGIPPEVRRHIFEPFFTTKKEGKGTGLGLATVHGIVAQSGGFIEVESEVGRGTLFRVHFPRATS
jgi:signal transduction histidine kinase